MIELLAPPPLAARRQSMFGRNNKPETQRRDDRAAALRPAACAQTLAGETALQIIVRMCPRTAAAVRGGRPADGPPDGDGAAADLDEARGSDGASRKGVSPFPPAVNNK